MSTVKVILICVGVAIAGVGGGYLWGHTTASNAAENNFYKGAYTKLKTQYAEQAKAVDALMAKQEVNHETVKYVNKQIKVLVHDRPECNISPDVISVLNDARSQSVSTKSGTNEKGTASSKAGG